MDETNKLAAAQEKLGQALLKLYTNMQKDSPTRKTETYVATHKKSLEKILKEVDQNHEKLVTLNINEHNYFKSSSYKQIIKIYEEAMKYLKDCPKSTTVLPTPEQTGEEEGEVTQLLKLKKQKVRLQQLAFTINQTNLELLNEKSKSRYEALQGKILKQWDAIFELNEEIQIYESKFESDYFTENQFIEMKQRVDDVIEQLGKRIRETKQCNIVLPQVKIPTFEGGYENWTSFSDIFQRIIHTNVTLAKVEKMQYLKTHVKGEASRIIQHLQISEVNYDTAWMLLQNRYQNNRLIISKLLDKIFNIPPINYESAEKIKQLHDTTTECLEAINNLGIPTDTWGPLVSHILIRKWDSETNKLYEQSLKNPQKVQSFQILMEFLKTRFQSLEAMSETKRKTGNQNTFSEQKNGSHENHTVCKYCQNQHSIYMCTKFKALSTPERQQFVKNKKLCSNCINHDVSIKCKSSWTCRICRQSHHTLLHNNEQGKPKPSSTHNASTYTTMAAEEDVYQKSSEGLNQISTVLLATAMVQATSASGELQFLRVLVDPGSQASFLTEEAAQILALPRQKIRAEVSGLGEGEPRISNTKVEVQLKPRFPSNFSLNVNLLILPKLTQTMPRYQLNSINIHQWQNQILADPTFSNPGPIDIILGAEEYGKIILTGLQKTDDGLLGQNTEFGWILSGNIKHCEEEKIKLISMISRIDEDRQLTKFWEIEELDTERELSFEDIKCEEKYEQTVLRNPDGSYTVQIPFKERPVNMGDSKSRATARLLQLEKKLYNDSALNNQYRQFMQDYLDLGHMEKVQTQQENEGKYFIPHHAVLKESSTTTKLRVVFDASCKTSNGISLNETMYVGPKLQQELFEILIRWRRYQIAFSADIEKMYRQIKIDKQDQEFQRILWRFDKSQPMQQYKLTTVTYGTASAPYLAIKTLQQLAEDEKATFPEAAKVALRDFYVDDVLSGADTIDEALQLQNDLIQMLKTGRFLLRKWSSNKQELLDSVAEKLKDASAIEISNDGIKKSLGVHWAPVEDTFHFRVETASYEKITKRSILSEVAKLFDPLGWLAPVVIVAKLFIQDLWLQELEWDQPAPKHIQAKWISFNKQLKLIEDISLPRWIQYTNQKPIEVELHGFCDASEKAYGGVIYVRVMDGTGVTKVTLLTAKSKVAPARTKKTIPRLELCSALLLAKLMKKTIAALEIKDFQTFAWTDSMVALAWIKGNPTRWKTFVANRVTEINSLVPSQCWNHVKTTDNPADAISRGVDPSKLKNHTLWWNGPGWLKNTENWPQETNIPQINEEIKYCHQTTVNQYDNDIINRFSSLTRLIRVLSYCRRFINHYRKDSKKNVGFLTTEEMEMTLRLVVERVQSDELSNDYSTLQRTKQVEKKSKILTLTPFIDNGIMRVGGRLQNSNLPYNEKHPIILPCNSHLSNLIIRDAHQKTLHGGNQATLAYIRRSFWIINGKRAVHSMINKCITCVRYKAQASNQLMGELPAPRVTPSSPFLHSGVDYAGPLQIRATKGRGHKSYKGYIAIFICLATKAVHLEVVSDMTTDSFMAAFRRFIARRGQCAHMYSDNGTNFVGASKIIEQEVDDLIKKTDILDKLATGGTKWHFIPPAAPHFGGLWEAGVKSMKYHLKRVIGDSTLTYEELSTLLHQIEACLNSRPLCPLDNNTDEPTVLTPGHFLIGRAIVAPPNPITTSINTDLTNRWKLVQRIKKDFWKSWTSEYLTRLQQRYKWNTRQHNLKTGDIVLIKDDNINPSKWPLAKIVNVHPGKDEAVRVVTMIKSGGNLVKRSIHKLIPLPDMDTTIQPKSENITVSSNVVISQHIPTRREQNNKPCIWTINMFILIMSIISSLPTSTHAGYSIKTPKSGLYVEHVGYGKIERGTFRIELKFNRTVIEEDANNTLSVVEQFKTLCEKAKHLSYDTLCTGLVHHLVKQEKQFQWIKNSMDAMTRNRRKRGILGNFLTSVFGVNDEVYKDIDDLDKNQQELIRTSNHQTKFMLSALSTFNETEVRIYKQLNHFRHKLNLGLQAITNMQGWFSAIDSNKLNIHILSSYQIAVNFISEISSRYKKLMDIYLGHGNFFDLISPTHVNLVIRSVSKKLPSNLKIFQSPILKSNVQQSEHYIHIFGFFMMAEITEFAIIKVTPTPLKIENNTYWIIDVPKGILAIDYNSQIYFQLSEDEFKRSVTMSPNQYLCSPTVVKNIETSPNCIIDEIYQRNENHNCEVQGNQIKTTIWKELYMSNTWLFINNKPTRVAVTCNGTREDVILNMTGIIQISQDCIIKTKQNILAPKRDDRIPVLAGFSKQVPVNIVTNLGFTHTKV